MLAQNLLGSGLLPSLARTACVGAAQALWTGSAALGRAAARPEQAALQPQPRPIHTSSGVGEAPRASGARGPLLRGDVAGSLQEGAAAAQQPLSPGAARSLHLAAEPAPRKAAPKEPARAPCLGKAA